MLLFLAINAIGQTKNGSVKGTVKTSDGVPADLVTLSIKGVGSVMADQHGHYSLKNIPAGNYTLTARLVGINPVSQEVTVTAGETLITDITLHATSEQLNEVTVNGAKTNKYSVKQSQFVSKMPLKDLENPQVYSVVSKELMADQVITNFDDALKNAPGVDKLWSSTGRGGDGAGYFSLRGFAVQPTLVNGLPGLTNGSLDISNIERIEVVKGPSGTLYGSSLVSYGGLINVVTKQPFDATAVEVNYTAGSYGLNRITADINTPLDKDHKVLFRMNAAYQDENSWQDAGFKKTRFVAPSLTYKVNDRLTLSLNTQFLSSENTNPTMLFFNRADVVKTDNLGGLGYNPKKSYTSNSLGISNPVSSMQAQMVYKISDEWTSQTVISRGSAKSKGYYSYLYENSYRDSTKAFIAGYPNVPSSFTRSLNYQNTTTETTDIQQNFNGDFKIGGLRNRVVAGLDYFNRTSIDNSSNYVADGIVTLGPGGKDTGVLTSQGVDALIAKSGTANNSNTNQQTYSAYVSDVLNITSSLSAMASLRIDRFQNSGLTIAAADKYGQTALSPKFGLVYQLLKDKLSVFGNYMNGFTNSAPVNYDDNGISKTITFKPEEANQWETGIKTDLFDGKLSASLSYYDIKVSNVILTGALPNTYTQGGNNLSKGFEFQVNASPFTGFDIIAGYTKNTSKLTNSSADYEGRRPESAGPADLVNLWLNYRIMTGSVKGLGFGFGGNYAGKNMILNRATTGVFALPSYTVLNASVSYATGPFTFALKVNNLTDKEYYKGWSTLEPMAPRTVAGSIGYRF
ncbi:TonB-dependent receptor [Pedobacter sp. L105]|uniref:TonB-dependent receptor n=1 Tax=Pedobacter sp. L105 TaxID=1641871 RepID=UPI00131B7608|nr:TonB-dependent receptor [Pedobacter sp. L105]